MNILIKQKEIADFEGFTSENDIFERKALGERLMRFMSIVSQSVLILDGDWGSGKSTFIKQWCGLLRQNSFPVIYFDAFENDYAEDIFSSLAAEIISAFDKSSEVRDNFVDKVISACKVVGTRTLSRVLESYAGIRKDDIEAVKNSYQAFHSTLLTDEFIRERLTARSNERKCLKEFKLALSQLVEHNSVSQSTDCEENNANELKPLIFVIDELDRCKPTYALNLLETIKHFYSVKNVNFILVTNMKQLENTVQRVYGASDSGNYLEKFYDLKFSLNNRNQETRDISNSVFYVKELMGGAQELDHIEYLKYLIINNNIELRTCERLVSLFNIVNLLNKNLPKLLFIRNLSYYLCFLKIIDNDLYCRLRDKKVSFNELKQSKYFPQYAGDGGYFALLLEGCLKDNPSERAKEIVTGIYVQNSIKSEEIIPFHCNMIDEFYVSETMKE